MSLWGRCRAVSSGLNKVTLEHATDFYLFADFCLETPRYLSGYGGGACEFAGKDHQAVKLWHQVQNILSPSALSRAITELEHLLPLEVARVVFHTNKKKFLFNSSKFQTKH